MALKYPVRMEQIPYEPTSFYDANGDYITDEEILEILNCYLILILKEQNG